MAKQFKTVRSEDALTILIEGDRRNPEPTTLVVKFPGGHIEVSRCSDDTYWAHVQVVDAANVVTGRIDYAHGAAMSVAELPDADKVVKLAARISNTVPHFDPDN